MLICDIMRQRKKILTVEEYLEILELFDKSPLTVTAIAKAYGINRMTIYKMVHKFESPKIGKD